MHRQLLNATSRLFAFLALPTALFAAESAPPTNPTISAAPDRADALYAVGDTVRWTITRSRSDSDSASPTPATSLVFRIRRDFQTVLREAPLELPAASANASATIEFTTDQPGAFAFDIHPANSTATDKTPPPLARAGAFVSPDSIARSAPRPADFDTFWDTKLAELAQVPANPVLTPGQTDHPEVTHEFITFDLPRATHARGQLSRPCTGDKFPAIVIYQWAGVYPLPASFVTDKARQGWLALNLSAHDLPIAEPADFYKEQDAGPLKNYPMIGCEHRESSYFLRMFLATSRAVDYLASRPDWDGRTLVVTGASQGGLQAIVAAALNPKVTALLAIVPAGSDTTAPLIGRSVPWPGWGQWMSDDRKAASLRTAPYYDAINFASRVRCPALIGYGLLDPTSTPAGVHLMTRELRGPVERILMPAADHKGAHTDYNRRSREWLEALRHQRRPSAPP